MDNLVKILEDQGKAFEEFKTSHKQQVEELSHEVKELYKKANRPPCPSGVGGKTMALKTLDEFARQGGTTSMESKSWSSGSGPDGGYAVPEQIDSILEHLALPFSPMRQVCNVVEASTGDYKKLVNTRGLEVGHVGEAEARPETDTPTLAEVPAYMGELYALPFITQTALDDIFFDAGAFLTNELGEAFGVAENDDFTVGNGTKKAKGFLAYTATSEADGVRDFGKLEYIPTGTAGGFKTASATVSPADDLINMVYKLKSGYRQGAVWMMNSLTLGAIRKWKDTDGANVWTPSLAAGQPSTLLGYPVVENASMPDIGSGATPIAFGNFRRGYTIVDRLGFRMTRDPYTNRPYVGFYCIKRVGGMLVNSEAIKLLKNSAS